MHTPIGTHPFSEQEVDASESRTVPTVIEAGHRTSRHVVRLLVTFAFVVAEAVLRVEDVRWIQRIRRKRMAAGRSRTTG